jgi:hypothetical protein
MRRDILAKDVANRDSLHRLPQGSGNLYFDSIHRTLDDPPKQASFRRDDNVIALGPSAMKSLVSRYSQCE